MRATASRAKRARAPQAGSSTGPHTWTRRPTVTLLGHAAHVMPPLGVGVNLATLDAAELALALRDCDTVAIRDYEHVMLPRSTEIAHQCAKGLDGLLAPTPDHAHSHLMADLRRDHDRRA